jgi:hypothetical protein
MSALTPRRIALIVVATVVLLFFVGMLLSGLAGVGSTGVAIVGPVGSVVMGAFATSCAACAAWGAHGGQRRAWLALAVGLGASTAGAVLWSDVALGGIAPISNPSVADLGYVVLPLSALTAALLVPSRDDSRFGIGLLLDGIIVAASLVLALGSLVLGRADTVSCPRIMLAAVTAFYLGLVVGAATIARSVIELAEVFGIASVAEGVENEGTAQWLKKFGCDVVQGNYFSGPLPAGEIPHVASNPIWATD